MLKIYDEHMNVIGYADKKQAHKEGVWHKVVGGILYCAKTGKVYFQTIFPKASYTFERDDYIDFAVGGHIEGDETELEAIIRECQEELGLEIAESQLQFLRIRVCNCDLSESYKLREFQYFYAIQVAEEIRELNFTLLDNEIKSLVEIDIDDFLGLLRREISSVDALELIPDRKNKILRTGNIVITDQRIVPDYFDDKDILALFSDLKLRS